MGSNPADDGQGYELFGEIARKNHDFYCDNISTIIIENALFENSNRNACL